MFESGHGRGGVMFLASVIFLTGCFRMGRSERHVHDTKNAELQGAESVQVRVDMPAGKLSLTGGDNRLLEADFDYTESEGTPRVSYDVTGKQGHLVLSQPGEKVHVVYGTGTSSAGEKNRWTVRLAKKVPMDLSVSVSAGNGDLRLGELSLTKFNLELGVGELTADFKGDWKHDLDGSIHNDVGKLTLLLPDGVGVRVHVDHGIGSVDVSGFRRQGDDYVNSAYGKSPVTLRLKVETGIGSVRLVSGH